MTTADTGQIRTPATQSEAQRLIARRSPFQAASAWIECETLHEDLDTQRLEAGEISRAVIETIAESASVGIIAPLFLLAYMALGGVPLAMAYKAVNTLDSMSRRHT